MNNRLQNIILYLILFTPLYIVSSDSPHPPREAQNWFSWAKHEWKKFWYTQEYTTDGNHLEILTYLTQTGQQERFYEMGDYWHHKERSMKRAHKAGNEIVTEIRKRNYHILRQLIEQNGRGLPDYLITTVTTIISRNATTTNLSDVLAPPPGDEDIVCKLLGKLAKHGDRETYTLAKKLQKRGTYLLTLCKTNHCIDGTYLTEVERGLKTMRDTWYFLKECIENRNPDLAQKVLNNTEAFLPVAHVTLFQRAIDALKTNEQPQTNTVQSPTNAHLPLDQFEVVQIDHSTGTQTEEGNQAKKEDNTAGEAGENNLVEESDNGHGSPELP